MRRYLFSLIISAILLFLIPQVAAQEVVNPEELANQILDDFASDLTIAQPETYMNITVQLPSKYDMTKYYKMMGVLTLFLLLFVIIVYGVAKLFRSRELGFAAREEFIEIMFSLVIALIIAGGAVLKLYDLLGGDLLYTGAEEWLNEVQGKTISALGLNTLLRGLLGLLDDIAFEVKLGILAQAGIKNVQPFEILKPLVRISDTVSIALILAIVSIIVQKALLWFGHYAAIQILLPIGVVLRAVKPVRMAGAFLMSFSIIMFIGLPLITRLSKILYETWNLDPPTAIPSLGFIFDLTLFSRLIYGLLDYAMNMIFLLLVLPLVNYVVLIIAIAGLTRFLGGRGAENLARSLFRRGVF